VLNGGGDVAVRLLGEESALTLVAALYEKHLGGDKVGLIRLRGRMPLRRRH